MQNYAHTKKSYCRVSKTKLKFGYQDSLGSIFYCIISKKGGTYMSLKNLALKKRLRQCYWTVTTAAMALFLSMNTVFAATDNIWTKFSNVMKEIYTQLLGISTIVAVAAAIALIIRMVSKNQRAVDEATSWLNGK